MDLISDRGRRVTVASLDTTRLLFHAQEQARQRKLEEMLIVDVDSHHYESEHFGEFLPYIENDVLRQLLMGSFTAGARSSMVSEVGYQDTGGRVTRYPLRATEKTSATPHRDVQLGHRWMDAMSVDYACLFPTGMLSIGLHPHREAEVDFCWAYNRWLTERLLPESGGRLYSMLCLPFGDPEASFRQVCEFGHRKGVAGFMVTGVRPKLAVHDNLHMRTYRAIEERELALSFHPNVAWSESTFQSCNRFLSAHALSFTWYNILHCTNWIVNGMGERFPKLPVIWLEAGLAWIPFLMQRLDHEYMLRPSEAPLLRKKPSDYMRDMYYATQPMEIQDEQALQTTFRMMNAESQLLFASDYPHWDFDLPSTIYDRPWLSERAKHNILGGTAARLFKLPPRNEAQRQNLQRFGNLTAA
jgi:predicted TIM-barrel fold metal-dependent hydrolase